MPRPDPAPAPPRILCAGAMLWDVIGQASAPMTLGEDVPGRIHQRPGGVALNVALALARQGLAPGILSALGRDPAGDALLAEAARQGVDTRWLHRDPGPTGTYMAIEGPQGLVAAVADARGLEAAGPAILAPLRDGRLGDAGAPWSGTLVVDGNLTEPVLALIARAPWLSCAVLRIVPASPDKAPRLRPLLAHPRAILHLNRLEAEALARRHLPLAAEAAEAVVALGAARVLVTDGPRAVADAVAGGPTLTLVPPAVAARHVTGAGDSFLAGHLAAEDAGAPRDQALAAGIAAATRHITAPSQGPLSKETA